MSLTEYKSLGLAKNCEYIYFLCVAFSFRLVLTIGVLSQGSCVYPQRTLMKWDLVTLSHERGGGQVLSLTGKTEDSQGLYDIYAFLRVIRDKSEQLEWDSWKM